MSHDWVVDTWIRELAVVPRHHALRRRSGSARRRALPASRRASARPDRQLPASDVVRQTSNKLLE